MKTTFLILAVALTSGVLMSCESNEPVVITEEEQITEEVTLASVSVETTLSEVCVLPVTDSLSETDRSGLLLMREEEKLAGDVYRFFYSQFKYPVFNNISRSETAHSNAVLYLLKSYNIADPSTGVEGTFTNPEIQELFTSLTTKGSADIVEALKIGAFIEEYDIKDLKHEITATNNSAIIRVYSNLLRGSGFHLKAFTRLLKFKGVIYTPQILSQEEYDAIVK